MKKITLSLLAAVSLATAVTPAHAGVLEEIVGGFIGGGLGAALCDGLGANNEWTMACGIGGAILGSRVAREMSEADMRAYSESQEEAWDGEINHDYRWEGRRYGSDTDIHGRIRPVGRGYNRRTREECRTFKSVTYRGNRAYEQEKTSIVCRRSDGTFYSLEQRDVYVNGRLVESQREERSGRVEVDRRDRRDHDYDRDYDREYDRRDRRNPPRYDDRRIPAPVAICDGWSLDRLAIGTPIYDARGYGITYRGYNPRNSLVSIYDVQGHPRSIYMSEIAIPGCHYGLRDQQYVSTARGDGRVLGIYQNGDALILFGRWSERIRAQDIYR